MLFGGLIAGFAGDRVGRRPLLLGSLLLNCVAGAMSGALPYWQWLGIWRVVSGLGVGGSVPTLFTLICEYVPAKDRGFFISVVAWWWMVGTVTAAGVAWLMLGVAGLSWRPFVVACAAPAALSAVLAWAILPESPRYLLNQGHDVAALRALERIAKWNGAQDVDVAKIILSRRTNNGYHGGSHTPTTLATDGAVVTRDSCLSRVWSPFRRFGTAVTGSRAVVVDALIALLSPKLRRTSLLLAVVWVCLSFGWYGLNTWIPTLFAKTGLKLQRYEDSFLVAAANLPGNILATFLVDRIGRKPLLASSLFAACVCALGLAFATTEAAVVAAACLINMFSVGSWNTLDALSVEMFPTAYRSTAAGLLAATGRIGSIGAQFVFGALIDRSIPALLSIAAGMLLLGAVAGCVLPREPRGSELAEDDDGDAEGLPEGKFGAGTYDGRADIEITQSASGFVPRRSDEVKGASQFSIVEQDDDIENSDTSRLTGGRSADVNRAPL